MKRDDFFAALHTAAPDAAREAVQKWIDFAVECVERGQYVNFIPAKDQEASVESWLDTLCAGVYAVQAEYGAELAGKLVNLSLDKCCLYPGEMRQAAECLRDGGTAETIIGKINSGEIESKEPFFPMPAINNKAPKSSVLNALRQCQEDAGKHRSEAVPPAPHRDQER